MSHSFKNSLKGNPHFNTSGTPPQHPKIQSIYDKSLPEEIRKEIKYFPLHGRISGENLTLFDKFLISIGKIMEQDETLKNDMGKDFDDVQRENLLPLLEYPKDVRTRLIIFSVPTCLSSFF